MPLKTWAEPLEACMQACRGCANCGFVSMNIPYSLCAWYSDCNASRLLDGFAAYSWRTAAVRGAVLSPRLRCSGETLFSASSCPCSQLGCWNQEPAVPCRPSPLCGSTTEADGHRLGAARGTHSCRIAQLPLEATPRVVQPNAAIVTSIYYDDRYVRPTFRAAPEHAFTEQLAELHALLRNLRRVGTSLPIYTLVNAERRHPNQAKAEQGLRSKGIHPMAIRLRRIPSWASEWHRGSFAKLQIAGLTRFSRVVFIDNDCVVLRNLDHLARLPAPSVAFHEHSGLNSGMMVVEPSHDLERRVSDIISGPRPGGDGGDQEVWAAVFRALPCGVFELPLGYNFHVGMMPRMANMTEVRHIHLAHAMHGQGGKPALQHAGVVR